MVIYIHLGRESGPTHLASQWPEAMVLEQWLKSYLGMEYTDGFINDVTSGVFAVSSCNSAITILTSEWKVPLDLYQCDDGEWILKIGSDGIPVHFFDHEVIRQADHTRAEGIVR